MSLGAKTSIWLPQKESWTSVPELSRLNPTDVFNELGSEWIPPRLSNPPNPLISGQRP